MFPPNMAGNPKGSSSTEAQDYVLHEMNKYLVCEPGVDYQTADLRWKNSNFENRSSSSSSVDGGPLSGREHGEFGFSDAMLSGARRSGAQIPINAGLRKDNVKSSEPVERARECYEEARGLQFPISRLLNGNK